VENDLFSPPAALPKHVNRRQAGGTELQVLFSTANLSLNQNLSLKVCQNAQILWKTVPKRIFAHFLWLWWPFATRLTDPSQLINAANSFLCVVFELKCYKLFMWKETKICHFSALLKTILYSKNSFALKIIFSACWLLIFLALRSELGNPALHSLRFGGRYARDPNSWPPSDK
jgi:hypothetical protein